MTYVVGAGEGKGLCKTWHLFLRLVCVFSGTLGNSLAVLPLHASTAGGTGSIPGQGTKILPATRPKKKKKIHDFCPNTDMVRWVFLFPCFR